MIFTEIIKILLISLLIIYAIKRLLTNPLEKMATYAKQLSLDNLDKPLKLSEHSGDKYDSTVFIKWYTTLTNTSDDFKTIKTTEAKHLPPISAHMACIKNDWGKKVIDKINKNINKENILKIRAFIRKWQLDKANLKEFDKINAKKFGY